MAMSNVTLTIGGRHFTVACADGEEDHITVLGQMIADKLDAAGGMGSQNESRMLLFGALMLADELHELRERAAAPVPATAPALPDNLETRIASIADHLENLASRLEGDALNA